MGSTLIYVDDIGMAASGITLDRMNTALALAKRVVNSGGLTINEEKTVMAKPFSNDTEFLGLHLGRSKVSLGHATQAKLQMVKNASKKIDSKESLKKSLKGLRSYKGYIDHINKEHKLVSK